MTTADEDIFGQIDALLGKRSSAVLTEKNLQGDDFPMLTEVIKADVSFSPSTITVEPLVTGELNTLQVERRVYERRQVSSSGSPGIVSSAINDSVLDALEIRLLNLFRSQNASLENALRLIIREERERNKSD